MVRDGVALRYEKANGALTPIVRPRLVLRPQLLRASGHFCQLEVPDRVNAMLVRFLAILPSLDVA